VGVGQNENMQAVLRFLRRWHSAKLSLHTVKCRASRCMFPCMR
jgi:hypothetical protein